VFLQKTFSHCIDTNKKLDDPKQTVPNPAFRFIDGHKKHEDGRAYIKEDAIKTVLLPNFEQQILFEQREYVLEGFNAG
jgi:hypothetical protein